MWRWDASTVSDAPSGDKTAATVFVADHVIHRVFYFQGTDGNYAVSRLELWIELNNSDAASKLFLNPTCSLLFLFCYEILIWYLYRVENRDSWVSIMTRLRGRWPRKEQEIFLFSIMLRPSLLGLDILNKRKISCPYLDSKPDRSYCTDYTD